MSDHPGPGDRGLPRSLAELHPRSWDIPAALTLSAALLGVGLFTPIITIKQFLFMRDSFSVVTGIQSLWREHQKMLAVIVFVFSVVFPILKLAGLTGIWFGRFDERTRQRVLKWFSHLGKWSMLDVFVVAVTIVVAKISAVLDASARPGLFVFAASVLLSIVAAIRVETVSRRR